MSGATVNLTLLGTNTLKSGEDKAGLQVPSGATLEITAASTGSLTATGATGAAGIGGDRDDAASGSGIGGTITINGGTVTAIGSTNSFGAGIGGGRCSAGGNTTINGGTVIAIGGYLGAGIGGGGNNGAYNVGGSGGTITINSGTVTASGGDAAAARAVDMAPAVQAVTSPSTAAA
jgi:hypothetical protein